MKFLITNDDGIDAGGLAALVEAASQFGSCVVLAPDRHLSGCAHQATTDRSIALTRRTPILHCIDGTPVDCVRLGLGHVAPDADWVLSGVNEGGNLGADVYHSGTVAAAREAALMDRRTIAVSQYRRRGKAVDWERATRWTTDVLRRLLQAPPEPGVIWNVNLPDSEVQVDPPELVFCPLDPHPLPVEFRQTEDGKFRYAGVYHARPKAERHDVDVCFDGAIAVSKLHLPQAIPSADAHAWADPLA
jgi:5'-nucleotidase